MRAPRFTRGRWFLVAALLAVSPAYAVTYVVDNQNPAAADNNAGTRAAPLRTIGAAALKVRAGDEVLVRPGIYRETLKLTQSGELGKPIVFRSEVPGAATISGSEVVTEWKKEATGVWSAAAPQLTFNKWGNPEWIYIDGFPLQSAPSRELLLPGSFFLDFTHQRVWVAPEEGQDIAGHQIEFARREGLVTPAKALDDIHFIGFNIVHNADWFRGKSALVMRGRRWLVENNRIAWASYNGLTISSTSGCVIRNNLIEWCGDAAIGGDGNINMLVENNRFLYGNWRRIRPSFEGGISKWSTTYDSILRGNEAAYFYGSGLWMDTYDGGNVFENNVVHDSTGGAALFTEISWGDIFRNNVVFNNDAGITIGESPNSAALRNVVFNNGIGIRLRGNYRRELPAPEKRLEEAAKFVAAAARIPDIAPARLARLEAEYLTYWGAPKFHLSTNALIWDNVLFDNASNYFEHRDYSTSGKDDPYINNFSDNNIFYQTNPDANIRHNSGGYGTLAGWQKASGRDTHSTVVNPRDSATVLPPWAAERRGLWTAVVRSSSELDALNLNLIESPTAAVLRARLLRSPSLRMLTLRDNRVRGCLFEIDGEPALAVWTKQLTDRRPLRFKMAARQVTLENAYGSRTERPLRDGTLDLVASYLPCTVRGVTGTLTEAAVTSLAAQSFNAPGQNVPLTATIVNDAAKPQDVEAVFSCAGFTAVPSTVQRRLKAGESARIQAVLRPDGSFTRGTTLARLDAAIGGESLVCTTAFVVGEGAGSVPRLAAAPRIDGDLSDWGPLDADAQLGSITDDSQITDGKPANWTGPNDLSARFYAAWRPDALYVAAIVTDDRVVPAAPTNPAWDADAVEVFLDGRASEMQWQLEPTEGVVQIGVSPNPAGPVVTVLSKASFTGVTAATAPRADGYTVELRIPLTAENFPAGGWEKGRSIKMSVLLDDKDDAADDRENVLGWSFSPLGRNFRDTSGWKTVVLE